MREARPQPPVPEAARAEAAEPAMHPTTVPRRAGAPSHEHDNASKASAKLCRVDLAIEGLFQQPPKNTCSPHARKSPLEP